MNSFHPSTTILARRGMSSERIPRGGGIVETADIQACEPEVSFERAVEVDDSRAEGVFISCTGFRSIENIERLEQKLGKPVISSNQATSADCLRIMGIDEPVRGFGALFERIH